MTSVTSRRRRQAVFDDIAVIVMTGVLAGCGLIYEYLLANTAGRMLGAVESVIFAMIGVMIVSMGVGAFLARFVRGRRALRTSQEQTLRNRTSEY